MRRIAQLTPKMSTAHPRLAQLSQTIDGQEGSHLKDEDWISLIVLTIKKIAWLFQYTPEFLKGKKSKSPCSFSSGWAPDQILDKCLQMWI